MSREAVIQANIDVHTALAARYDESEPHFRKENVEKVGRELERLRSLCAGGRMLDLGCGTGFMISLGKPFFAEIHGVDVTPAMLERVDRSGPGEITLHLGSAESTPFPDGYFDLVTAYSFLHHAADYREVLREAHRVLKPGGICYTAQDPNRQYWKAIGALEAGRPDIMAQAVAKACEVLRTTDDLLEARFGTPSALVKAAEPIRSTLGGLDPDEVEEDVAAIGYGSWEVRRTWFLGEADVLHGHSSEAAAAIDSYLRSVRPLADHLFKYLQLTLVK